MLTSWSVSADAVDGAEDSLRAAISAANTNGESDTINLAAGTYTLELVGGDNDNAAGDLDLGESDYRLLIQGAGAGQTFIDANEIDRVFDVLSGVEVVITDLTIRGGKVEDSGGAIRNSGVLTLNRVNIEGSSAKYGGGIFSAGELKLVSSVVSGNTAELGGGVANLGELTVSASTLTANTAEDGAGIWNGYDTLPRYDGTPSSGGGFELSGGPGIPLEPALAVDAPFTTFLSAPSSPLVEFDSAVVDSRLSFGDSSGGRGPGILPPIGDPIFWPPIEPPPFPIEQFQAGTLTAGTIDDHLNIDELTNFASPILKQASPQGHNPLAKTPVSITVQNASAEPIGNAGISVREAGTQETLFETFTNSAGLALYLPEIDGLAEGDLEVSVTPLGSEVAEAFTVTQDETAWSFTLAEAASTLPQQLDVALVVDVTGSMSDELEFLKVEIESIAADIDAEYPDVDVKFSMVVYRDRGDAFITRTFDFVDSVSEFQDELAKQRAGGGGDYPEAMHTALEEAEKLSWRDGNTSRVAFLVADAPPHDRHFGETIDSVLDLRDMGVHIYPVGASGVADSAEAVMRTAAYVTNGEYLFLTDHSGFGNSHADPNTESFDVEFLDDAMLRMIQQELQGGKIQPDEIIDHVRLTADPEEVIPGKLVVLNSTISGNEGEGINVAAGLGEIKNSTVVDEVATASRLAFFSSIVDGEVDGPITSAGFNLFSDDVTTDKGTDTSNASVLLGPLVDNGGITPTHLPLAGSPAIDSGATDSDTEELDQRGAGGIADGDGDNVSAPDIGAVEAASAVDVVLGEGEYDFSDFLVLSHNFGSMDATAEDGDLNGDGFVNFADFLILTEGFQGAAA